MRKAEKENVLAGNLDADNDLNENMVPGADENDDESSDDEDEDENDSKDQDGGLLYEAEEINVKAK